MTSYRSGSHNFGHVFGHLLVLEIDPDPWMPDVLRWGRCEPLELSDFIPAKLNRCIPVGYAFNLSVSGQDWEPFILLALAMGLLKEATG